MPDILTGLGTQAIGLGMGLATQGINDRRQIEQQEKLNAQQARYDDAAAQKNYIRQMDLWNKTGYVGQMKQLKEAGLNPALIYAKGGAGGTTQAAAVNRQAPSAPSGGMEITQATAQAMQMAMLQAQIENTKADTEKKKVETVKTGGVDTEKVQTEVRSLTQGIENQKAAQALQETQNEINKIELKIKGESTQDALSLIRMEVQHKANEIQQMVRDNWISEETKQEKIDMIKTELIGMALDNKLTKKRTDLTGEQITNTKAQTKATIEGIFQRNKEIMYTGMGWETKTSESNQKLTKELMDAGFDHDDVSKVLGIIGIGMSLSSKGGKKIEPNRTVKW